MDSITKKNGINVGYRLGLLSGLGLLSYWIYRIDVNPGVYMAAVSCYKEVVSGWLWVVRKNVLRRWNNI